MGTEILIVFIICGFIVLLIILSSCYRRKKRTENANSAGEINRIHETIINGQRTFRIATVSRQEGRLAMDVYEIRLPRANDPINTAATITLLPSLTAVPRRNYNHAGGQPPPPFSTAINMPSPSANNEDTATLYADNSEGSPVPPPRYDEVIPISTISGNKVPEVNASTSAPVVRDA